MEAKELKTIGMTLWAMCGARKEKEAKSASKKKQNFNDSEPVCCGWFPRGSALHSSVYGLDYIFLLGFYFCSARARLCLCV